MVLPRHDFHIGENGLYFHVDKGYFAEKDDEKQSENIMKDNCKLSLCYAISKVSCIGEDTVVWESK